ncbi:MAG: hypothetical protein EOP06_23415 [Proteobacteria bacterium]|nr:MAG: hypothetical protein EOP06_23415 [Pseudomonadota bacterium]
MKLKAIGIAAIFVVGIVAFQNCSQVNFAPTATGDATGVGPTGTETDPDGPVVDIGDVPEFKCKSFVELDATNGQVLDVPARSTDGVCFLAKLISSVTYDPAESNPNVDNDIVSRDHAGGIYNDAERVHSPFNMGSKTVRLLLRGARSVKLSGGKNETSKIVVDNFILVGLSPTAQIGTPSFYKAYGTSDSTVRKTNSVLFKSKEVPLKAFATGGTSTFTALALDGSIEISRDYSLDVRALDAGSAGNTSDIYVIFQ